MHNMYVCRVLQSRASAAWGPLAVGHRRLTRAFFFFYPCVFCLRMSGCSVALARVSKRRCDHG